jgi:preprotein translocase subunit SecB
MTEPVKIQTTADLPKGMPNLADRLSSGSQMKFMIMAQYLKDLSFESPLAPDSLKQGQEPPKLDIRFHLETRKLNDPQIEYLYEVAIKVMAQSKRQDTTVFIAEVIYGVVVNLSELEIKHHHSILLVDVPRLAFPFVRNILSEVTMNSGFPNVLLTPVDFASMYLNEFGYQN